jgi:phenylpropionate dioxygenase-like ring-hydroxylating dioxygenase large terminal subunit
MDDGNLVCGYHGWTYDRDGKVVRIPQYDPRHSVESFHCQARYGYVWVALEKPLLPLFDIPEDGAPGFRRIFQFYDQWQTAPLRLMENSFDNAHFATSSSTVPRRSMMVASSWCDCFTATTPRRSVRPRR